MRVQPRSCQAQTAAAAGAALGLLLCAAALAGFGYLDALRVARSRAT